VTVAEGGGPSVTFGLFDWVDADGARDAGQLYTERLDLLAGAESAGFDIYHLAEHHGTPLGLAPSPSVFLAAAAVRTTRIRLCPLVYVLPLYHPTRRMQPLRGGVRLRLAQLRRGALVPGTVRHRGGPRAARPRPALTLRRPGGRFPGAPYPHFQPAPVATCCPAAPKAVHFSRWTPLATANTYAFPPPAIRTAGTLSVPPPERLNRTAETADSAAAANQTPCVPGLHVR
jgi:hypothetical protein